MVDSTQEVSHMPEREEMSSTGLSEPQLSSQQRREDQLQEDHPRDPETFIYTLNTIVKIWSPEYLVQILHFHKDISKIDLNIYLVRNHENSHSFHLKLNQNKINSKETKKKYFTDWLSDNSSPNVQILIERWSRYTYTKETSICEKYNIFNEIMKIGFYLEEEITPKRKDTDRDMKDFELICHQESRGKTGQFAFAVAYMQNGKHHRFPMVRTNNGRKYNESNLIDYLKHSEEILIEYIEDFLEHAHGQQVQRLFIFSLNSPCLNRLEENSTPCMILLLNKANEWKETYGFFTDVIFKKAWGLRGPKFFKDSEDVNFPCPHRNFQVEIYENENCCNNQTSREVEIRSKEGLSHNLKDFIQTDLSSGKMFKPLTKNEKKEKVSLFNDVTLQLFEYDLKSLWGENCPYGFISWKDVELIEDYLTIYTYILT